MNKKTWLKGGLIALVLYLVIFIPSLFGRGHPHPVVFTTFPGLAILELFTSQEGSELTFNIFIVAGALTGLFAFILGALIGWVSGYIKKQQKVVRVHISVGAILGFLIALGAIGLANMRWFPILADIVYLGLHSIIGQTESSVMILSIAWIIIGMIVGLIIGKRKAQNTITY